MPTSVTEQVNAGVCLALISQRFPLHPMFVRFGAYLRDRHNARIIIFVLDGPIPAKIGGMTAMALNASDITSAIQHHNINAVVVCEECDVAAMDVARLAGVPAIRFEGHRIGRALDDLRAAGFFIN